MNSPTSSLSVASPSKILNAALWVVQLLLALVFGAVGWAKLTQPVDGLVATMAWTGDVPPLLVRFIGLSELLGAIGLLLPSITRIMPGLTPLAGAGLAIVMLLALGFHATRGELVMAWRGNTILGLLAVFVAWGRSRKAPIPAR